MEKKVITVSASFPSLCVCAITITFIVLICALFSLSFFIFISNWFNVFRLNPINADILYLSDKKRFESSHFNKSNPLIVFLHGFSERVPGGAGQSSQEIRDGMYIIVFLIV